MDEVDIDSEGGEPMESPSCVPLASNVASWFPANLYVDPSDSYPSPNVAEFWGTICGCVSVTPPSRTAIWDHCEFLRRLGLFFYPYLGFFVCTSHGESTLFDCCMQVDHLQSPHCWSNWTQGGCGETLGAEGVIPGRYIEIKFKMNPSNYPAGILWMNPPGSFTILIKMYPQCAWATCWEFF